MSVIIGVDPGSIRTGWGVVSITNGQMKGLGCGVIHLAKAPTFELRLAKLAYDFTQILKQYRPQILSIEKVFLGKNPDSAFKLGHARGVALAVAGMSHIPVEEYATRYVKKIITGSGAAAKEQVQFMVQKLVGLETQELDATDALALAVCACRNEDVRLAFAQQNKELR